MGCRAAKVGSIQEEEQKTRPGWNLKAGDLAEYELEMVWAWLCD